MTPAKKSTAKKSTGKSSKKDETVIQPEINIGLIGHVDHGKTTLVKALSGKWTDTHSEEVKRGITIRLGYADTCIWKGKDGLQASLKKPKEGDFELVRKISFVDAPGHESLMATMLSGAAIMDGALLLVAANEACPQPQTREHLMALEIIGIKKLIIIQNKIDLVSEEQAKRNYKEIKEFVKHSVFKDAEIIPLSAQHNINIDFLLQEIESHIPTPERDPKADPVLFVARSFDINKPGTEIDGIKGGVLGGSLKQGTFKIGDEIEIRPGRITEENNQLTCHPIHTKIVSLIAGGMAVDEIGPGGSVGLSTALDPSIVKSDQLSGSLVGKPGMLPDTLIDLVLDIHLLERVVGSSQELDVEPIKMGEVLMLNVNSTATIGVITKLAKGKTQVRLKLPVCAEKGSRATVSRRIGDRFRLIGYGIMK
ncbi:MAG: translation initiation factor IF-2 subunit gamma [archaeon]